MFTGISGIAISVICYWYITQGFFGTYKKIDNLTFFAFLADSSISGFFNIFNEYSKSRIALRTMMIKKQAISNVSRVKIPTLLIKNGTA